MRGMSKAIHPLRRWLFEHQETLAEFGARSGIAQGYLSEILNEKKRPSLDVIDKITIATARDITANDFQRVPESESAAE
jgi:transcriptional regulator with XRE-family HTH domain